MFWTAVWRKIPDGCFWHVCKTIYSCGGKVTLTVCALYLSSWRLKCYYNQRNSVGTDRENIVPGNLIIILKLNEAWPLKKNSYSDFRTALKAFKTQRKLHHCLTALKVFNTEKRHHHCLKVFNTVKGLHYFRRTLKVFNIAKGLHHLLETLRGFNFKKWLRHILITRKIYQNSYSVECWWTATSEGRLSYHIYD